MTEKASELISDNQVPLNTLIYLNDDWDVVDLEQGLSTDDKITTQVAPEQLKEQTLQGCLPQLFSGLQVKSAQATAVRGRWTRSCEVLIFEV